MTSRILIVDRDAAVHKLLSRHLRRKGFEVAGAFTGKEAKELAENGEFHLAIVGANLEGEYGLNMLRLLKSTQAQLPVIILSGGPKKVLPRKAVAAGANGFLHKTNSLNELLAEVCRHISTRAGVSQCSV